MEKPYNCEADLATLISLILGVKKNPDYTVGRNHTTETNTLENLLDFIEGRNQTTEVCSASFNDTETEENILVYTTGRNHTTVKCLECEMFRNKTDTL